jgi:hypothetical protein
MSASLYFVLGEGAFFVPAMSAAGAKSGIGAGWSPGCMLTTGA